MNMVVFNQEQQAAVDFVDNKPLKIMAGAGTGKTQVITGRFVNLVKSYNHNPERILCLTFTVKAAQEMKRRITDSLKSNGVVIDDSFVSNAWISNFHQFCTRLLNEYPYVADYDPESQVITEHDRYSAIKSICLDLFDKDIDEQIEIKSQSSFINSVYHVIGSIKNMGITPDDKEDVLTNINQHYKSFINDREMLADDTSNSRSKQKQLRLAEQAKEEVCIEQKYLYLLYDAFSLYEKYLRENKFIDYEDIINFAKKLVVIKPDISNKFSYIMVDEFQDTGESQYELIKILAQTGFSNVTVVGDIKQSIYEWRDARPVIFERFPGEVVALTKNYRSARSILDMAHEFIVTSMPAEKKLTCGGINSDYEDHFSFYFAQDRNEEAIYIAQNVINLVENNNSEYGDIAVLMRSVRAVRPYINLFDELGIPYKVFGYGGLFEDNVIKDICSIIRAINDPYDNYSWSRILQSYLGDKSDMEMYEIFIGLSSKEHRFSLPVYDHLHEINDEKIKRLLTGFDYLKSRLYKEDFSSLLFKFIVDTEYYNYIYNNHKYSMAKLYELFNLIDEYFATTKGATLDSLLEYFKLLDDASLSVETDSYDDDFVKIMTVHQSKGLEFDNVFVANLKPGSFPMDNKSGLYEYDSEYGFYLKSYKDKNIARYAEEIKDSLSIKRLKEERRVLYVALTRARKKIFISASKSNVNRSVNFFSELIEIAKAEPDVIDKENIVTATVKKIKSGRHTSLDNIIEFKNNYLPTPEKKVVDLSFSHIAVYDDCPLKYKYKYIDKIPLVTDKEQGLSFYNGQGDTNAVEVGNIIHKVLQYHHSLKRRNHKSNIDSLSEKVKKYCFIRQISEQGVKDALVILENYLKSDYATRNTLDEEKSFLLWFDKNDYYLSLSGKIDRLDKLDEETVEIIDYKTNTRVDKKKYYKQLAIYQKAVQSLYGIDNIKTSLYFLRLDEVVNLKYSQAELDKIMADIFVISDNIINEKFNRTDKSYCGACEYVSFCNKSVI